ncbi:KxYKxGKxW signal peptide domain-containing protein [Levilactobacillus cerevisiae]|uniref:KxYKxGKxW signal peptide domain-containing protein n=1 Tax=Levilactobacillus cerevisiae TaxID=1704076 RepID=UPI000F77797A|nr:KxYKxGKxW signal peptide domain-containing protein [Levilactobacillus cerevisiae]
MKQADTRTTTKVHYKLYKAGKFWLVGTLATVSLVAGLAVTNPAQADTTDGSTASSSIDSGSSSTSTDSTTLSSSQESTTSNSASTASDSSTTDKEGDSTATSDAKKTVSTTAQNTNSSTTNKTSLTVADGGSHAESISASTASKPTESSTIATQRVASHRKVLKTTSPSAVLAASGLSAKKAVDRLMHSRLAPVSLKHTAITPVAEDLTNSVVTTQDNSTLSPVTLTTFPKVSNFYVSVTGSTIPYNSYARASLLPYSSEFLNIGEELFGFYVVLPKSITATLADVQTGATNYVHSLTQEIDPATNKPYTQISSLTAYQLADTANMADPTQDGRQVFYFQPDTNAKVNTRDNSLGYNNQIKMTVAVRTASDTSTPVPQKIDLNAVGYTKGDTTTLPYNDVLFAGYNSNPIYTPGDSNYMTMASNSFGADWPDQYVVGIAADNGAATLNYHTFTVTDSVVGYVTGTTDLAIYGFQYTPGTAGSTYTLSDYVTNETVDAHIRSNALYWKPSTRFVGTQIGKTLTIHDDGTAVLPTTAILNPTSLDLSINSADPVYNTKGITYVFYLDKIKTKLTPKNTTLAVNSAWTPDNNLTIVTPSGATDLTTLNKEGTLTTTVTNSSGQTVSADTFTQTPGKYTVTYGYKDLQGNKYLDAATPTVTSGTATIIVADTDSSLSVPNKVSVISGESWIPGSITTITDAKGNPLTSTKDLSITADGTSFSPTEPFPTTTPGTYPLTYSYTDSVGVTRTANTTLTVLPNQSAIIASKTTVVAGTPLNPAAAITSIVDASGKPITTTDVAVTVTNEDGTAVNTDTAKPGTYTVVYHFTDPITKLDVASAPVTLTITAAPTTGGSSTNTGSTTPDNGETPTTPTTPVKPAKPAKTTKPAKTPRIGKAATIKDPPARIVITSAPHYTPAIQTGVTGHSSPLSGGEAAAALNRQNGRTKPANMLTQAQADQLATQQAAANLAAEHAANGSNAATDLPQTGDQSTTWTAELGVLLLTITGALGFRRRRH